MDDLLKNLTWVACLVYLDDVIVFAKDFETHIERLDQVLTRFEEANLKLKPSKWKFAMEEVSYLGFKITKDGLKPDPSKTETIANLSAPINKGDVLRFLGMIGYYRRFISNFGKIAKCLFEVTKAKYKFDWTTEREELFVSLKKDLIEAPILIFPDFNNPFELFCDASATHVGAVLVQRINGVAHPVAFASRLLTKQERNYSASERELLAVVWVTRTFNSYIYGRHIKIYSDHKPLSSLVKAKEPNVRLYRLMLKLQELDYEILYYQGKLNFTADQLSRPPTETSNVEVKTLEYQANIDWIKEQENDKEIAIVRSNVRENLK
ncbi:unnamed protein product [Brachionus calyciflorus]|uniref:Reverse transcriptase domain-containing protein n=1 Tax=Brachionus calyciflorus TaxID=104777 RepID=A0A814QUA1_9BILA|nr:unnamed protein product [Brachionus calyciflorus]